VHESSFLTDLALVLGVAALTAVVARRFAQPSVLGYLVAGLIVGPYIPVPLFADPHRVESLAQFGVVLVMFAVGLELRLSRLARVLPVSGVTGLVQVGFLVWAGFSVGRFLGWSTVESLFLGGSLGISSTMVVTRIFADVDVPRDIREHVFGILIVQDVLAVSLIALLTGVAAGGGLEAGELARELARLAALLLAFVAFGLLLVPRALRYVAKTESSELLVVVAVGLCFALAYLATALGYSVALGAFVAGVLVAESGRGAKVEHQIAPLRDVFAAIFFVSIGMSVDPRIALAHLPETLLLGSVVVFGQLASVSLAGILSGNGLRRSVTSGLALGQIGEFAFIISGLGVAAGAVRPELRAILVTVAVVTAFTTPLALRRAEPILRFLDHHLPGRVLRLISLYERWFERWRARPIPSIFPRGRRPFRNLAFDASATILTLALALSWQPVATRALSERAELPVGLSRFLFGAAVVVLVLPLLVGLYRNARVLSARIADEVAPIASKARPAEGVVRRLLRSAVHLLVVLGVGVPALAILRPLAPGPVGLPLFLAVLVGLGLLILRNVRSLDREVRSGAATLAERLAQEMGAEPAKSPVPGTRVAALAPAELPGFEAVKGWRVPEGAFAVGKTLAELDLRAASGVAVVTLLRDGELTSLPRGEEVLRAGDILGLLGSSSDLAEGQRLLLDGPRTPEPRRRRRGPPRAT
jgi:CPA2 family monovalent cation:H+ antiporter-2